MPQIPSFEVAQGLAAAKSVEVKPSELGIQAETGAARNISRLTNEQAQYLRQSGQDIGRGLAELGTGTEAIGRAVEQHQAVQEISSMGPAYGNLVSNLTDQMHAAIGANDPAAIQQFRDRFEDQLDQYRSQAVTRPGQRHADAQVDELRRHFLGTALPGEMATAAYHKTVNDLGTLTNTAAGAAAKNPESLPLLIGAVGQQVDALVANHTLTPGSAEALKGLKLKAWDQVVGNGLAAVIHGNPAAGIQSNPSAGRQLVQQYAPYLTPQMQEHLTQAATAQDRVDIENAKGTLAETQRVEKEAFNQSLNDIVASTFAPDGRGQFPDGAYTKLIQAASLPGADPEKLRSMKSYLDALRTDPKGAHDDATFAGFSARMFKPDGDPQALTSKDVFEARAANKLTQSEFSLFNEAVTKNETGQHEAANRQVTEALSAITNIVNPKGAFGVSTMADPGAAGIAEQRAKIWFTQSYQQLRQAGKTATDAVNQLLPNLADPSAVNAFRARFAATPADALQSVAPPAAKPKASAFDFMFGKH